jgi:hypothetical protein
MKRTWTTVSCLLYSIWFVGCCLALQVVVYMAWWAAVSSLVGCRNPFPAMVRVHCISSQHAAGRALWQLDSAAHEVVCDYHSSYIQPIMSVFQT